MEADGRETPITSKSSCLGAERRRCRLPRNRRRANWITLQGKLDNKGSQVTESTKPPVDTPARTSRAAISLKDLECFYKQKGHINRDCPAHIKSIDGKEAWSFVCPVEICNKVKVSTSVNSGASCSLISQLFCNTLMKTLSTASVKITKGESIGFSLENGWVLQSQCS
ncbi:hypothetical protein PR048_002887 [Dryococelus australis]|uniref:Uncharacterized protein n=1 Tax=Dryococelus australis TaxID=614101 RepID=A0ABQ9ILL5_9NEOP|nr:hypothetical protein PR048_002887 [Dryococelus australis]